MSIALIALAAAWVPRRLAVWLLRFAALVVGAVTAIALPALI